MARGVKGSGATKTRSSTGGTTRMSNQGGQNQLANLTVAKRHYQAGLKNWQSMGNALGFKGSAGGTRTAAKRTNATSSRSQST